MRMQRPVTREEVAKTMLGILLIILLVIALAGGGIGYGRYGYARLSPAAIILIILLLTGNLSLNF